MNLSYNLYITILFYLWLSFLTYLYYNISYQYKIFLLKNVDLKLTLEYCHLLLHHYCYLSNPISIHTTDVNRGHNVISWRNRFKHDRSNLNPVCKQVLLKRKIVGCELCGWPVECTWRMFITIFFSQRHVNGGERQWKIVGVGLFSFRPHVYVLWLYTRWSIQVFMIGAYSLFRKVSTIFKTYYNIRCA